jgi:Fe-S-cluster containining protein
MMFKCSQCGVCCRHLDRSELYRELDRGDGVCRYLKGNLCSIYENRPLLCRIDESYDKYFSEIYTRDEYYRLNEQACKILQSE